MDNGKVVDFKEKMVTQQRFLLQERESRNLEGKGDGVGACGWEGEFYLFLFHE